MSQVTDDLARYKSGDMTLDELAAEWAQRDFGTADDTTKSVEDVWLDAEDTDHTAEGTWGEVRSLRDRGLLTPEEYATVSAAADEAGGAAGREMVTDVPDPGAGPTPEAKGVVPCKDCPPLTYTPVTSTSGATKTVTLTSTSSDGGYTSADMDARITDTLLVNANEEIFRQMSEKAEGGLDKNRGGAEKLRRYWVHGEGAAKIQWGTPGDWSRCVAELTPHMGVRAKGYCNLRHHDALGVYPGQEKTFPVFDLETKTWDETLHPRNAEGESDGGKFKPKGSGAQDVGKQGVRDRRELSDGDRSSIKDMIDEMTGGGNRQDLTAAQRAAVKKMIDRLVNPTNTASTDDPRKPFRDASDKNRTALRDMVDRMSSDGRFKDLPPHARDAILAAMRALGEKPAAAPKQKAKGMPFVDGGGLLQFKSDGVMNVGMPDGVMVALYAPDDVAMTHAMDGGTPPTDMHMTLAYLGKADDVPDPRGLHKTVADFAAARGPVDAVISGVGRFAGDSVDGDPVYLSVDSSALPQLRADLVAALEGAGYDVRKDHGFSPHMTLGYVPADAANPVDRVEPTSTQFGLLSVAYGPDVWDYPMGDPNASSNSDAA